MWLGGWWVSGTFAPNLHNVSISRATPATALPPPSPGAPPAPPTPPPPPPRAPTPRGDRRDSIMSVNPNSNKHSPEGLEGVARRFVEFGGGVGADQIEWLGAELAAAKASGQRVIVAGHVPFWWVEGRRVGHWGPVGWLGRGALSARPSRRARVGSRFGAWPPALPLRNGHGWSSPPQAPCAAPRQGSHPLLPPRHRPAPPPDPHTRPPTRPPNSPAPSPGTCPDPCVLWNYEEVLDLLEASGVVVATLAGHAHKRTRGAPAGGGGMG